MKMLLRMQFLKGSEIRAKFRMYKLIMHRNKGTFGTISIETHSLCNRKCKYCPVTYYPRKEIEMPEEVFYRIIDQLGERNYKEMIGLGWFNEPLLDERLPQFIQYARSKCPKSYIYILSNGDLLDIETLRTLIMAGLSRIYVTQYDKELSPNLGELLNLLDSRDRKYFYLTKFRYIYNRAGALKELQIQKPLKLKCKRPDNAMIINAEGKVVLCCSDYFGEETMGDVAKENVFDIWVKPRLNEIRAELRKGNRQNIDICSRCDFPLEKYPLITIRRPHSRYYQCP